MRRSTTQIEISPPRDGASGIPYSGITPIKENEDMSLKSIAVVVTCLVMMQGPAWSAPVAAPPPSAPVRNNVSPLPPGGPATIKQAQGMDWRGPLIGAAVTAGIFLAVLLLINDDADGPFSTTSSQ